MEKNREARLENEAQRDRFTTIDDLLPLADKLVSGLRKLSQYKHPLDVRRAGKGVVSVTGDRESKQIKAGSKTYFVDIEETRDRKRYLKITESRFKGEGSDRERSSIIVFPEHIADFVAVITEMADRL